MNTRRSFQAPTRFQRGLTLVELMVGLTLGLMVTAALLTVLAQASNSGRGIDRASTQIETGRYVAEMLAEDLRLAGFYGEIQTTGALYTTPDACATDPNPVASRNWASAPFTLPAPVQGYRPSDSLGCLDSRLAETDAVAIRRVSSDVTSVASIPAGNAQRYVQYSYCASDPAGTKLVFDSLQANFILKNRACTAANGVRAYVARTYFIAACNRCGATPDGIPTLKRMELIGNTQVETALAEGVEMLRLEYGFDVDGDGNTDLYLRAPDGSVPLATWDNVVSIKVHYVTRSIDKASDSGAARAQTFTLGGTGNYVTAADGYIRRAYTTVVRLVNPSGAREVQ
jgi:type IV pilus assembly protein PilW